MFSSPPVLGLLFLMINITFYYCYFFPLEGPCAITWDRGMTPMLKKRGGILLALSGQPLPRIRTSSWHHHSRSAVPPTSLGSDFSGWRKMRSLTKKNQTVPGGKCSTQDVAAQRNWKCFFHDTGICQFCSRQHLLSERRGQNQSLALKASVGWVMRNAQSLPGTRAFESVQNTFSTGKIL